MCFFRPRMNPSLLMDAEKNRTIDLSTMIARATIAHSAIGFMPARPHSSGARARQTAPGLLRRRRHRPQKGTGAAGSPRSLSHASIGPAAACGGTPVADVGHRIFREQYRRLSKDRAM